MLWSVCWFSSAQLQLPVSRVDPSGLLRVVVDEVEFVVVVSAEVPARGQGDVALGPGLGLVTAAALGHDVRWCGYMASSCWPSTHRRHSLPLTADWRPRHRPSRGAAARPALAALAAPPSPPHRDRGRAVTRPHSSDVWRCYTEPCPLVFWLPCEATWKWRSLRTNIPIWGGKTCERIGRSLMKHCKIFIYDHSETEKKAQSSMFLKFE